MGDWIIVVKYDSLRDALTLSWTKDGTPWSKRAQGASAYEWEDVARLLEEHAALVTRFHRPRLF